MPAAALLLLAGAAFAQTYPTHVVRIIVPFAAGGLNDTAARLIQPYLEKGLGQTVIVENRPAASGIVGSETVAKATPDGHTLLMVASALGYLAVDRIGPLAMALRAAHGAAYAMVFVTGSAIAASRTPTGLLR